MRKKPGKHSASKPPRIPAATPGDRQTGRPLPDIFTQIQQAKEKIVAAVIDRAVNDGSYQHAKWLFEFGGIAPTGHHSPADDPPLMRLFLDQLQIPESPEELAAEFRAGSPANAEGTRAAAQANDHAVE